MAGARSQAEGVILAKWGELSERDTVIVEMAEKIARLDAEAKEAGE
jgi:hypothetical protein